MKIKLDENLPVRLVGIFSQLGHEVDTVPQEGLKGHRTPRFGSVELLLRIWIFLIYAFSSPEPIGDFCLLGSVIPAVKHLSRDSKP